ALFLGLQLTTDLLLLPLKIETDSQLFISMICNENDVYSHLIFDCRTLLHQLQTATLDHIYREANGVADALAKYGMLLTPSEGQLQWSLIHFMSPPSFTLAAFNKDLSGSTVPRFVPLCNNVTV
ncbi:hypothetical protein A4A49_63702, partial [Nicotiana attenuata]